MNNPHTICRRVATVAASAFLLVAVNTTAADAGTGVTRIATVSSNPSVYEPITPALYSTAVHENVYIRFDRTPEALWVRWVKCGSTSTQDQPSSVGGQAVYISRGSDFGGVIGTNFRTGTCLKLWARADRRLANRPSYPIEAYLATSYRF